jgi:restriction system protein
MIPDYQKTMLPVLEFLGSGKLSNSHDAAQYVGKYFKLTEQELNELLPNTKKKIINNRVHWARAHLKMAGAIINPVKGMIQITERGKEILKKKPDTLTIKYLMEQYEDYREKINSYRKKKKDNSQSPTSTESVDSSIQTPEEQIEFGYQTLKESLEIEILLKLKAVHPSFFEKIVVELLVKMGYGGSIDDAAQAIGKSGDEGIDGIIKEDKLGLDVIYIQAKRWQGVVGRPEIQKFVGALAGQRAKKGVFITTSHFTREAIDYAAQMDTKIVLIDGEKLSQLMIDYNLGVSVQNTYEIKKIDSDYFEEE